MALLSDLRGFLRQLFGGSRRRIKHQGDSLARTLRESTHARAAHGGLARAGSEQHHEIVAEGHERYTRSLDEKHR